MRTFLRLPSTSVANHKYCTLTQILTLEEKKKDFIHDFFFMNKKMIQLNISIFYIYLYINYMASLSWSSCCQADVPVWPTEKCPKPLENLLRLEDQQTSTGWFNLDVIFFPVYPVNSQYVKHLEMFFLFPLTLHFWKKKKYNLNKTEIIYLKRILLNILKYTLNVMFPDTYVIYN